MRLPIIAANWKMYKTVKQTEDFIKQLLPVVSEFQTTELIICPPFTSLFKAASQLQGSTVSLGAQNLHWEDEGAYTGEISGRMLKDIGVTYVIIGHSERRNIFGENNNDIRQKIEAVLRYDLRPILCVGEKEKERRAEMTERVITEQIRTSLISIPREKAENVVVAYEPVWAIGTGTPSTDNDAQGAAALLRHQLVEMYGELTAKKIRILYGGSVKSENIGRFMDQPDIDGALVGGASLQIDSFLKLVRAALR